MFETLTRYLGLALVMSFLWNPAALGDELDKFLPNPKGYDAGQEQVQIFDYLHFDMLVQYCEAKGLLSKASVDKVHREVTNVYTSLSITKGQELQAFDTANNLMLKVDIPAMETQMSKSGRARFCKNAMARFEEEFLSDIEGVSECDGC